MLKTNYLKVLAVDSSSIDEENFERWHRLHGGFVHVDFQPYLLTDFEDEEDTGGMSGNLGCLNMFSCVFIFVRTIFISNQILPST